MKVCWTGESCTIEEALLSLGYSKNSLKKAGINRKNLNKVLKEQGELKIPSALFNRGEIFPLFDGKERPHILGEEGDLLALHKPTRVHCHPLEYNEGDNILSFLREEGFDSYLKVNNDEYDRGLLYRLDYETTGLCLLTKSEELYLDFRATHHEAKKIYQVTINGAYEGPDELCHKLSTSGLKVRESEDGKDGKLFIHENSYDEESGLSTLKVQLKGGLRHQIRVQMALSGYPLMGDILYGGQKSEIFGLHCLEYQWKGYSFCDPIS